MSDVTAGSSADRPQCDHELLRSEISYPRTFSPSCANLIEGVATLLQSGNPDDEFHRLWSYASRAGGDLVAPSSGGLASQLLDAVCVTVPKCLCGSLVAQLLQWRVQPECHLPAI